MKRCWKCRERPWRERWILRHRYGRLLKRARSRASLSTVQWRDRWGMTVWTRTVEMIPNFRGNCKATSSLKDIAIDFRREPEALNIGREKRIKKLQSNTETLTSIIYSCLGIFHLGPSRFPFFCFAYILCSSTKGALQLNFNGARLNYSMYLLCKLLPRNHSTEAIINQYWSPKRRPYTPNVQSSGNRCNMWLDTGRVFARITNETRPG